MSGCIYVDSWDAGPTVSREELRRARKPYTCGECGEPIAAGDLYEYVTGLWDGYWDTHRTCARCVNVRTDYFVGWFYGQMVADFYEAHGVDYREGIPAHITPCRELAS